MDQKKPSAFFDFRHRLRTELEARKLKYPSYSLRRFALFLKIDASTLQKLMSGKRPLGTKLIQHLGERMDLGEAEIAKYISLHKESRRLGTSFKNDRLRSKLKVLGKQFAQIMSQWEIYPILTLADMTSFSFTIQSVSDALGITRHRTESLIADLENVGWLVHNDDGTYHASVGGTTTDPNDPAMAQSRVRLMKSVIEKSLAAYTGEAKPYSIHYARTVAFNRDLQADVMVKIRNFCEDLEDYIRESPHEENDIYQIQIGFYPLTGFFRNQDK